jgi:hypothetical protein
LFCAENPDRNNHPLKIHIDTICQLLIRFEH